MSDTAGTYSSNNLKKATVNNKNHKQKPGVEKKWTIFN
jgi:hypothetical protein